MLIQCPACHCCFSEAEATYYQVKNIFNNRKKRLSTHEYLESLDTLELLESLEEQEREPEEERL